MVAMNGVHVLFNAYPQKRELEFFHTVHVLFFLFPILSENLENIQMFITTPLYD